METVTLIFPFKKKKKKKKREETNERTLNHKFIKDTTTGNKNNTVVK